MVLFTCLKLTSTMNKLICSCDVHNLWKWCRRKMFTSQLGEFKLNAIFFIGLHIYATKNDRPENPTKALNSKCWLWFTSWQPHTLVFASRWKFIKERGEKLITGEREKHVQFVWVWSINWSWRQKVMSSLTWFCMPHHFNTTAVACHQRWLVSRQCRIVERIFTPCVSPRIALIAIYRPSYEVLKQNGYLF